MWRAGMAEAVDLYHIKTHYFTSHPKLNYYAIVPVRPLAPSSLPRPLASAWRLRSLHCLHVGCHAGDALKPGSVLLRWARRSGGRRLPEGGWERRGRIWRGHRLQYDAYQCLSFIPHCCVSSRSADSLPAGPSAST